MNPEGELVRIDDTSLFVVERGAGYPVVVLHGGPGLDPTDRIEDAARAPHIVRVRKLRTFATYRSGSSTNVMWPLRSKISSCT